MQVGSLAGVTYLRYTVLTSPKNGETVVHCCDPAISVLVMLVSRNNFHVVSALQSIVRLYTFFWLIRSLVDLKLVAFIVCGPLQFLVSHSFLKRLRTSKYPIFASSLTKLFFSTTLVSNLRK